MSEKQEPYICTRIHDSTGSACPDCGMIQRNGNISSRATAIKITYTDDVPDVRDYLIDLRRDLLRKVKQLDELIARIPQAKPPT
jgi:hypothetical protein